MADTLLEVRGISKIFDGLTALDGVSFDVRTGEIRAVIGPNGAGKTTLFNIICRVFSATSGDVTFNGKVISRAPAHNIAKFGIARTFQNLQIFGTMTVFENVMVGCHVNGHTEMFNAALRAPSARREEHALQDRATAILERIGLTERSQELAAGLPVGQQRLLELGRALAMQPKLILLDEPAAGLTTRETTALSNLVRRIRDEDGITIVLIEHDMSMVMGISDRVVVLDHGQAIADATPGEIQKDERVIAAYLGVD